MSRLTTEEKLSLVLDLTKKHSITAYEIGSNTELDSSAVHRILTGEVKKPRDRTLSIILEYIENKIVGTEFKEPRPQYFSKAEEGNLHIEDLIARRVVETLKPILAEITTDVIRQIKNMDIEVSRLRVVQEKLLIVQEETLNKSQEILEKQEKAQKGLEAIEHKL